MRPSSSEMLTLAPGTDEGQASLSRGRAETEQSGLPYQGTLMAQEIGPTVAAPSHDAPLMASAQHGLAAIVGASMLDTRPHHAPALRTVQS